MASLGVSAKQVVDRLDALEAVVGNDLGTSKYYDRDAGDGEYAF
jgi:hypothetical protein